MMTVGEAQHEVRSVYLGGFVGQLVSATVWFTSAALATWGSMRYGIVALVAGGFFIFPLTQLALRASGRRASLSPENPLRELAIEVAFVAPLMLPLIGAAALYRIEWFYPAFMLAVGAHYLPFSFLYGMRQFLFLGGALLMGGVLLALYLPGAATWGAWLTGLLLTGFAFLGLGIYSRESRAPARTAV